MTGLETKKIYLLKGSLGYMLSSSEETVFCDHEEANTWDLDEEAYRQLLRAHGAKTHYYSEDGEPIDAKSILKWEEEGVRVLADTYFPIKEDAEVAALALEEIFKKISASSI